MSKIWHFMCPKNVPSTCFLMESNLIHQFGMVCLMVSLLNLLCLHVCTDNVGKVIDQCPKQQWKQEIHLVQLILFVILMKSTEQYRNMKSSTKP